MELLITEAKVEGQALLARESRKLGQWKRRLTELRNLEAKRRRAEHARASVVVEDEDEDDVIVLEEKEPSLPSPRPLSLCPMHLSHVRFLCARRRPRSRSRSPPPRRPPTPAPFMNADEAFNYEPCSPSYDPTAPSNSPAE